MSWKINNALCLAEGRLAKVHCKGEGSRLLRALGGEEPPAPLPAFTQAAGQRQGTRLLPGYQAEPPSSPLPSPGLQERAKLCSVKPQAGSSFPLPSSLRLSLKAAGPPAPLGPGTCGNWMGETAGVLVEGNGNQMLAWTLRGKCVCRAKLFLTRAWLGGAGRAAGWNVQEPVVGRSPVQLENGARLCWNRGVPGVPAWLALPSAFAGLWGSLRGLCPLALGD